MDEKYTNALSLNMSFYDVTTEFFKEIVENIGEQRVVKHEPVCCLRMSIQLAKAYYKLLGENLEKYEKQYGEIPNMPTTIEINKPLDSEGTDDGNIE